jgi:hypothetical protein
VRPRVIRSSRGRPSLQRIFGELVDVHANGVAGFNGVLSILSPHWKRQVAARTGRKCHEEVDFCEELEVVAWLCRTGLHKVLVITVEPGALEDIDDVVHVEFSQPVGLDSPNEVGVAVIVKVHVDQHLVHIGVATSAEKVVNSPPL